MHEASHPRDDVDSMCLEKKDEENLPAFKIVSIHRLEDYIKKSMEED